MAEFTATFAVGRFQPKCLRYLKINIQKYNNMCNINKQFIPSLNDKQVEIMCRIYSLGGKEDHNWVFCDALQHNAVDYNIKKILNELSDIQLNLYETQWVNDDFDLTAPEHLPLIDYDVVNNCVKINSNGSSLIDMYFNENVISGDCFVL